MKMLLRRMAALIAVAWLATAALDAHHGTLINYDRSKQWTAKAVVREFKYVNPHAQLFFDVTDAKGNITHWSGELLPNPAQLIRNGWSKKRSVEALQYGTPIVVTVVPSKKGGDVALVLKIENEKGEELLGAPVQNQ
ncbi:MAG TPA: DUF6152 family protein [Vicinamibacterales bacterium]|nr:DUF6152 family protein [Vicinamibacterales bacterium]